MREACVLRASLVPTEKFRILSSGLFLTEVPLGLLICLGFGQRSRRPPPYSLLFLRKPSVVPARSRRERAPSPLDTRTTGAGTQQPRGPVSFPVSISYDIGVSHI